MECSSNSKRFCYLILVYNLLLFNFWLAQSFHGFLVAKNIIQGVVSVLLAVLLLTAAGLLIVGLILNNRAILTTWLLLFGFYCTLKLTGVTMFWILSLRYLLKLRGLQFVTLDIGYWVLITAAIGTILSIIDISCVFAIMKYTDANTALNTGQRIVHLYQKTHSVNGHTNTRTHAIHGIVLELSDY